MWIGMVKIQGENLASRMKGHIAEIQSLTHNTHMDSCTDWLSCPRELASLLHASLCRKSPKDNAVRILAPFATCH